MVGPIRLDIVLLPAFLLLLQTDSLPTNCSRVQLLSFIHPIIFSQSKHSSFTFGFTATLPLSSFSQITLLGVNYEPSLFLQLTVSRKLCHAVLVFN